MRIPGRMGCLTVDPTVGNAPGSVRRAYSLCCSRSGYRFCVPEAPRHVPRIAGNPCAELPAFTVEHVPEPPGLVVRGVLDAEALEPCRGHPQPDERPVGGVRGGEVHQSRVVPAGFVSVDAFVVAEKLSATVENESAAINLGPLDRVERSGRGPDRRRPHRSTGARTGSVAPGSGNPGSRSERSRTECVAFVHGKPDPVKRSRRTFRAAQIGGRSVDPSLALLDPPYGLQACNAGNPAGRIKRSGSGEFSSFPPFPKSGRRRIIGT